jgi:hypothetical protein
MAKSMARVENGIVVNIEWCSDRTSETDTLKNIEDRLIEVGDSYSDGKFYRDGEKILTTSEKLAEYEALINELYAEVTA